MALKLKKKSKFFDLERDGITASMIDCWLGCKYECYLRYIQGWTARFNPDAIEFANIGHHCLEKAYTEDLPPSNGKIKALVKEYENEWEDKQPEDLPGKEFEQAEKRFGLAEILLEKYFKVYHSDFDNQWLFTEHEFNVLFQYANDKFVNLRGKLDGGFVNKHDNLWILDHKFLSRINEEELIDYYPCDIQCLVYLWAMWEKLEKKPTGLIYNICRRPTNYQRQDENLDDYLLRVQDEIRKKPSYYFIRIPIPFTKQEINRVERTHIRPIIKAIVKWYERGCKPRYYNQRALITKYGKSGFFRAITANDFSGLYKREKPHEELDG